MYFRLYFCITHLLKRFSHMHKREGDTPTPSAIGIYVAAPVRKVIYARKDLVTRGESIARVMKFVVPEHALPSKVFDDHVCQRFGNAHTVAETRIVPMPTNVVQSRFFPKYALSVRNSGAFRMDDVDETVISNGVVPLERRTRALKGR